METSQNFPQPPSAVELAELEFELDPVVELEHNHAERGNATSTCTTYWSASRCPSCY
ncbi:MAG TPA: hypothetical protein VGF17_03765 [Phytomonospora sp.]